MIDLDQSATTAVRRAVLEAMWPHLTGGYGNPSSTHALGRAAATALQDARARVAARCGVRPAQVVFTSGGTEADNLAVIGLTLGSIRAGRDRHIIVGAVEHEAVLEAADHLRRWHEVEVTIAPVDNSGEVDVEAVRAALRPGTALVSVQHANNEVGTLQPVRALGEAAHAVGALLHVDAVQTAGWVPLDPARTPVLSTADAISISGHKLGAPKGVGALVLRTSAPLEPLVHGGGQERDRRSGTENVAGAVGLATALELAEAERDPGTVSTVAARRDRFIAAVLAAVPEARLTGHPERRLPGHASFVVDGLGGEPLLIALDDRGIICSSGSACAAGRDDPSPVLLAMGYDPDLARTALRFSFGAETSDADLDTAVAALQDSAAGLRALR
ncbi:cysteine desulfurase family protein [Microcella daejeonensis]|uniref:cysteine desulfurase family protein n=1 Tax=Microcella daejeonensis TaxID=2994971 RepID=UPI002270565A|nr:cysteine desulfurase family protein [Microcella daejeonensis]WAB85314.1 cysteine desulfurase family protein [Microcella daejeonensis]